MKSFYKFNVMTIDEFKAWLYTKEITRPVRSIHNYHTIMPHYARFSGNNHLQILREVEENQTFENGYDEIAQHITVFPDSKIAICRDINKIPGGFNGSMQFSIRVEYIMNPVNGDCPITDNLVDYNIWLNALLCMKLNINPSAFIITNHAPAELVSGINIPTLNTALAFT